MSKLIILDRDGVINQDSDNFIKSAEEWQPIAGSLEAMGKLSQAGYTLVVATNQSGIARGLYSLETLHAMHKKMTTLLSRHGGLVDAVFYCPHGPKDNCLCRKPKSGLFDDISRRFQQSLQGVIAVGDSLRDLQAATAAGAEPVLVKTGKGERVLAEGLPENLKQVPVFDDLAAVSRAILQEKLFERR